MEVDRRSLHQVLEVPTWPLLRTSGKQWSHMHDKAPVKISHQSLQHSQALPGHSMVQHPSDHLLDHCSSGGKVAC